MIQRPFHYFTDVDVGVVDCTGGLLVSDVAGGVPVGVGVADLTGVLLGDGAGIGVYVGVAVGVSARTGAPEPEFVLR